MFGTRTGTQSLAGTAASQQAADAEKSAVDGMSAAIESHTANNARYSFYNLADQ